MRSAQQEELILPGDPPVTVVLKRSARARRLSLRVSHADGRVTLTLPQGARAREAHAFAAEKAGWIRRHLAARPAPLRPAIGDSLPFEGQPLRLTAARLRAPRLGAGVIELPAARPELTAARLEAFLKTMARARLAAASERHAARLGQSFARMTLRDPRSRWGSCSHQGNLMYSWRLVMAPPEVLDYVAAHEVAHLAVMDHSPRFWALVARLCPGHEAQRRWLRRHGPELHRYRFRD